MSARRKLGKMVGSMSWAVLDAAHAGQIKRAVLRDESELAIDVESEGYIYNATLRRTGGDRFEGTWSYRGTGSVDTGAATAILYTSSAGQLLFGEWVEEGVRYHWWAELISVAHFPDETETDDRSRQPGRGEEQ